MADVIVLLIPTAHAKRRVGGRKTAQRMAQNGRSGGVTRWKYAAQDEKKQKEQAKICKTKTKRREKNTGQLDGKKTAGRARCVSQFYARLRILCRRFKPQSVIGSPGERREIFFFPGREAFFQILCWIFCVLVFTLVHCCFSPLSQEIVPYLWKTLLGDGLSIDFEFQLAFN